MKVAIIQMSPDEEEQRLLRYIPSWSRLSNQERMRMLNNHILGG